MEDIVLDDDLVMQEAEQGDEFEEAESDDTDARIICLLKKGELRYAPYLGFGIEERLRGVADEKRFVRELKVELENDSFDEPLVDVSGGIENFKIYV